MKKLSAVILTIALFIAVLSGCSGNMENNQLILRLVITMTRK